MNRSKLKQELLKKEKEIDRLKGEKTKLLHRMERLSSYIERKISERGRWLVR